MTRSHRMPREFFGIREEHRQGSERPTDKFEPVAIFEVPLLIDS